MAPALPESRRHELLHRLTRRSNRSDANALSGADAALDDFIARFEPPSDEGEQIIHNCRPGSPGWAKTVSPYAYQIRYRHCGRPGINYP
jgi:hypothetical protein